MDIRTVEVPGDLDTLDRIRAFANDVAHSAPSMACTPGLFHPEPSIITYIGDSTLYVAETGTRVDGFAIVDPGGRIRWLLARNPGMLQEFARDLIPTVIAERGACFGYVESDDVRATIRGSRGSIRELGKELRDGAR